jgi:hypothetical protein
MLPPGIDLRIRAFIGRRALRYGLKIDILFESMVRGATSKEIENLISSINVAISRRSCIETLKLIRVVVGRVYAHVDPARRARIRLSDGTTVRVPLSTWLQSPISQQHWRDATVLRAVH